MVNQKKLESKFSYIASIDNCTYGKLQYCVHEK